MAPARTGTTGSPAGAPSRPRRATRSSNPAAEWGMRKARTVLPVWSSTQTACSVDAQSIPTNMRTTSWKLAGPVGEEDSAGWSLTGARSACLYCRSEALGRPKRGGVLLALEGRPTLAGAPALTEPYNQDLSSLRPSKGGPVTDAADAASVAQVALHCGRLRTVTAEDQTSILRLLAERRDDLAGERTRILNRLHVLLRDLVHGGAPTDLTAAKAAALLRRVRPVTATAACRRQLARDLLGDLRRVDARLKANKAQLQEALAATGSTLTQVHGLGVIRAAKPLGHVGDIGRFPSQDHFASYTATAPLDASSGNHQRHRLM